MSIWYDYGEWYLSKFYILLKWRDHFLVEYFGAGGGNSGCMGTIDPPAGQQVFLHGQNYHQCKIITLYPIMWSADCHNNTFLAVRTINDTHNNAYAQFYLTGNYAINNIILIHKLFLDNAPIAVENTYFQEFYDLKMVN